jgi:hypothetical protein
MLKHIIELLGTLTSIFHHYFFQIFPPSQNLNSYNVRYIYIVYILYSKANNNIYFHKSKETQKNGLIYSYFAN